MLKRLVYLILVLPMACVDPYKVEVPEGEQLLTVEGIISTGPGPHAITLTRSATYGSIFEALIRPVTEAEVVLRDDEGNVIFLEEGKEARGSYFTPMGFHVVVGKSYTLQILTKDGKTYVSIPEKVNPGPKIENVFLKSVSLPIEGENFLKSGLQLIVEVNDPKNQNNFYFWRNGPATYYLKTYPELFIIRPGRTPAPKACCEFCYVTEIAGNQSIFIAEDDAFNGLTTKMTAAFIEDNGRRFYSDYRIDLKQYAISQNAYRYLRLSKQQAELNGSIFDQPPASIRGNVISLDSPDEVVLGYFMLGDETSKRIYVNKSELTFTPNKVKIWDDCRVLPGAKVEAPLDWKK